MRSKTLSAVLVLLLIFGASGAVFAQDATPPANPPGQTGGPGGRGGQRGGMGAEFTAVIHAVATALNMTDQDVTTEMQGGKTLADIITEHNGDAAAITTAATTAATDAINAAVTAGTITQDNATRMTTNLADQVSRIISGQMGGGFAGGFGGTRGGGFNDQGALIDAVLTATKLDRQALVTELTSGKTLADVITEHGGTVDAVVSDAVTAETNQMNEVVKLNLLTQDQADQFTTTLKDIYTAALSVKWDDKTLNGGLFSILPLAIWETGLKPADVAERLAAGDTLAKVLSDNKVDVTQFVSDAAVEFQARLNAAITDGRMTQDQAGQAVDFFKQRLTALLNGEQPTFPGGFGGPNGGPGRPGATPEATAEATTAP